MRGKVAVEDGRSEIAVHGRPRRQGERIVTAAATFLLGAVLVGCGAPSSRSGGVQIDPTYKGPAFAVTVHAGPGTPMIGASVQVYAAGTSGNGSAGQALLTSPLTTDSSGVVQVPAGYACPSSAAMVYVVATGGKAGTTASANPAAVLLNSPGRCSDIAGVGSLTVNEATTAAAAFAFAQFLSPGASLGSTAGNAAGLQLAAGTLANLADVRQGTLPGPGFPATGTAPSAKLNLVANLLHGCVVSGPGATPCTSLFSAAAAGGTTPSTTLDAALNLARHPGLNPGPLFALAQAGTAPFTPMPASAPADWMLAVNFTGGGMNSPSTVGVDSTGSVWVASYYSAASLFSNTGHPLLPKGVQGNSLLDSYGAAVDANDNFWVANQEGGPQQIGTLTVLNAAGTPVAGSPYTQGGLNFPIAVAFDSTGVAWVVDYGDAHLTLLSANGAPLSGAQGYTSSQLQFPVAIAIDSKRNGWLANSSSDTVTKVSPDGASFTSYHVGQRPNGIAVDPRDYVWVANYYGDSVGLISNTGQVLSGANGIQGGGILHPDAVAIDGAGTVWVLNYRGPSSTVRASISQLAGSNATTPGAVLSPPLGWASDAGLLEPFALAIDQGGNAWVSNFGSNVLTEFVGMAAPVRTPTIGPAVAP